MALRLLAASVFGAMVICTGFSSPAVAQEFAVGDTGRAGAICRTEALARTAVELTVSPPQYVDFMKDPRVHCLDANISGLPPFQFIVEGLASTIEVDGTAVGIWRLRVLNGPSPAYSWAPMTAPTPGQDS